MTKVDCEDCYEKFTSKKLYINHVKSKSCSKTKVKNRQRAGHQQQEAVGQGAKRVRLEGDYYKPFKERDPPKKQKSLVTKIAVWFLTYLFLWWGDRN